MLAQRLHRPRPIGSGPLGLEELDDPAPGAGEVLIAVDACAVCRTDLQLVEGDLAAHRLPIVPGHQVVGRVRAVGAGVDAARVGERVGLAWLAGACGRCPACRRGAENLCRDATFTGWDRDGGYATLAVAADEHVHRLPEGPADEQLAPLLCGGAIGYRCLQVAGATDGMRLGLYGFGASATLVLQLALRRGCTVHVATRAEVERERAASLGATSTGGYDDAPPRPLDAAITFAPVGSVVVDALRQVDRGGTVVVNAIHLDEIPSFPYELLWWERSIRSVANVTRADVDGILAEAAAAELVTHTESHPLADAGTALERLATGAVRGAAVLHCR